MDFNSFASFVVENKNESFHDWHWNSQFIHCSPCLLKYQFISHLENANDETDFLFKQFGIENITDSLTNF